MPARDLFAWTDVLREYVGFLASYFMLGAIGFRHGVLRANVGDRASAAGARGRAAVDAAAVGLIGVALGVLSLVAGLLQRAAAKQVTVEAALSGGGAPAYAEVLLLVGLAIAFLLAFRRVAVGWPLAGVMGVAFALRSVLSGRVAGLVNPLHVLGGALWLGTLFVLVIAGFRRALAPDVPAALREQDVAEMVHRFSTVALVGASLLGLTGLVTSWTHLKPFSALWTTPYGAALLAKLAVVGIVLGLGAWNWRRVGPSLGAEGGARTIRRTSSTELGLAALVLLLTAILVSLPSPKLPH